MRIEISSEQVGLRLDALLGDRAEIGSRSAAQKLISAGKVQVAGSPARKSTRLESGQVVEVELSESRPTTSVEQTREPLPFPIVFEDADLLVVDKPAGLVVHPAPGHASGTLSQLLAGRAGGGPAERAGIVHRLDKDTSGLLVVAKSDAVLRALQAALQERKVERQYLALVRGRPAAKSGTIDAPLGRDRRDRKKVALQSGGARDARTHFATEAEYDGATLLRLTLDTGRTHQIRVHLAAIDLPVLGDREYGVPGALGLERQFLHACRLTFEHPSSGDALSFDSQLPHDLQCALDAVQGGAAR